MPIQTELELSYLAESLPADLDKLEKQPLRDIYFPSSSQAPPKLRLRHKRDEKGSRYEITKKMQVNSDDASIQTEMNINLTKTEFDALAGTSGRELCKIRYFMPYQGRMAEIDVFQGDLAGLVVIEFEFTNKEEKDGFVMPDFCLADVTQEDFIAGGALAGKTYNDIRANLERFSYQPLFTAVSSNETRLLQK